MELWRDIYGRVHVFPHTLGSMFGRAVNPEFRCSLLMPHALANRAVCQPLQVALSNKWSWVRADNTEHVDLVNLYRADSSKLLRYESKRFSRRNENDFSTIYIYILEV